MMLALAAGSSLEIILRSSWVFQTENFVFHSENGRNGKCYADLSLRINSKEWPLLINNTVI